MQFNDMKVEFCNVFAMPPQGGIWDRLSPQSGIWIMARSYHKMQ